MTFPSRTGKVAVMIDIEKVIAYGRTCVAEADAMIAETQILPSKRTSWRAQLAMSRPSGAPAPDGDERPAKLVLVKAA